MDIPHSVYPSGDEYLGFIFWLIGIMSYEHSRTFLCGYVFHSFGYVL